jgi:hypothetical protein
MKRNFKKLKREKCETDNVKGRMRRKIENRNRLKEVEKDRKNKDMERAIV